MKLLKDKELEKLDPIKRQDLIIDGLREMIDSKYLDKVDYRKYSEQLLKLYLLDKGESIEVDFSTEHASEVPAEDPDNEKMIRDDVFYADFSTRIKKVFN